MFYIYIEYTSHIYAYIVKQNLSTTLHNSIISISDLSLTDEFKAFKEKSCSMACLVILICYATDRHQFDHLFKFVLPSNVIFNLLNLFFW